VNADRVTADEAKDVFAFDPDKGVIITSCGPKGSGKSDFGLRAFENYPYDGLLIDCNADQDPHHQFTEPLPESDDWGWPDPAEHPAVVPQNPGSRFHHYRMVPDYLDKHWLEETDEAIGMCYRKGRCAVHLDEAADHLPVGQTPQWSRLALRRSRHRRLSLFLPMPRPKGVDLLSVANADILTVHGPLHKSDVTLVAATVHVSDAELQSLINSIDTSEHNFLAWLAGLRELVLVDPLPPRLHKPSV